MPQNKFEVLKSRVMQCGVEERVVRSMRMEVVRCFKCREEGHKCRECPVWIKRKNEEKAARPMKGKAQQEEWRRSLWEELRKRAEWYCGPTVPQNAQLWELGWRGQGAIVIYVDCPRCGRGGCYVEDDRGQETLPYWKKKKISWCGCKEKRVESGMRARDSRSAAKVEKVMQPREAEAQQSSTRSGEPESAARERGSQKEVRRTFKMLREV